MKYNKKRGEKGKKTIFFLVLISIILIDRLTKIFLEKGCILFFCVKREINFGAAFGILPGFTWLFIIVAIIVIFLTFFFCQKAKFLLSKLALTLIAAGTFANLIDRIIHGYVIDVITFSFVNFPSFNIADVSNNIGVLLLLIILFRKKNI